MNALKRVSNPAPCRSSGSRTHRLSTSSDGIRPTNHDHGSVALKACSFKSESKPTSSSSSSRTQAQTGQVYSSRRGIANWALQEEKNKRDYNKKVFKSIDQLNTGLKLEDKFLSVGQTTQSAQFSQLASNLDFVKPQPVHRAMFMNSRAASPAVARREGEMRTASPFLARKEFFVHSSPLSSPQISRHTRDSSSFGVSH